ncbi:hypothetical protein RND81_11G195300 [Saponaria officinalis]|uniref:Uncharacterized protein n=1 Tax=Saponaria officinalis TaxID=3572 RepID=A0AAW1HP04_SAPOF
MAYTSSSLALPVPTPAHTSVSTAPKRAILPRISAGRREFLLLTATTTLTTIRIPSANAKDIPLFGLRKKLEKAEEIVKEGLETAEKGLETAEKRVVEAEKEIEGVAEGGGFGGGLVQAGVVGAAEVFGVLVATSIVNSILGPEPKSS